MTVTQQKKVPTLRFPEFSGEWKSLTLLELSINGFNNGVFNNPQSVGSGYKLINVKDMYKGDQIELNTLTLLDIPQEEFEKNKVVYGDVFFTRSSLVKQGIAYSNVFLNDDKDVTYDGHLIKMSPNQSVIKPIFLVNALKTNSARRQLVSRGKTTTMTTIGQEDIASVCILLGSLEEQQKIAVFLSSVGTRIEQLGKKKALLEQYKKGMMQKLFSQEIRFKNDAGNDYPGWEKVKFSSLYSFQPTNSFSRDRLNYKDGSVRNIHYGDIHTKYRSGFELDKENVPFLETGIDLSKVSEASYCKEGDLVIADASEDYSAIGKTIELLNLNGEQVLAGLHTILARLNTDRVHVGYGAYVMACYTVKLQIMRMAHGTKVLGISAGRMGKLELPLPSREEQQKIADFLSAIDLKIELVAAQIEQTRSFKKGLLQQMFI